MLLKTEIRFPTAAVYIYQHIKLVGVLGRYQRLTNDGFQGLQTEIIVNISFINGDFSSTRYQINTCNRFFSSSCSVEFFCSQCSLPPS